MGCILPGCICRGVQHHEDPGAILLPQPLFQKFCQRILNTGNMAGGVVQVMNVDTVSREVFVQKL